MSEIKARRARRQQARRAYPKLAGKRDVTVVDRLARLELPGPDEILKRAELLAKAKQGDPVAIATLKEQYRLRLVKP